MGAGRLLTLAVAALLGLVLGAIPAPSPAQAGADVKLSRPIRALLGQLERRGITRENVLESDVAALSSMKIRIEETGLVQVYVHVTALGEAEIAALEALEVEVEVVNERLSVVQGRVPFDRLRDVAALAFVTRVTAPRYGIPRAGSVSTEGVGAHLVDQLHAMGVIGTGAKVGVISDGANNRADAVATSDLPPDITVYGSCEPTTFDGPSCRRGKTCNEGTAILEIVHDLAPGAQLAFAAGGTSLEFIQSVDDLANDFGADVIIDDYGFYLEPYFEDGPVAQAVAAVTGDVVWVSSAGNSADGHHEAQMRVVYEDGLYLHDFGAAAGGASDPTMDVTIPPGDYLVAIAQWANRFGASADDYDLYLVNEAETDLLCPECYSNYDQTGSQDPWEALCYYNDTAAPVQGKLLLERWSGSARRVELFFLGRGQVDEHNTPAGSVFGHSAVAEVVAVGAIDASDPGLDDIEPYSSQGPARIEFPALEVRPKPEVVAVDGVSVTGVGGFGSPFFGTSASAPHVAGIAALLKSRYPDASPDQVREALAASAVDLGAAGVDDVYGAGRVDAPDALAYLGALPATTDLALGGTTFDVAFDAARSRAYVSVPSLGEVVVVSPFTNQILDRVAVAGEPHGLDIAIDGTRLFVALEGEGAVGVVDLATFAVDTIDVASGTGDPRTYDVVEAKPDRLVVTASPGSSGFAWVALVALDDDDAVSRIASNRIIRATPTIEADRAAGLVYVSEGFSPNSLYKLDLATDAGPIVLEDAHGTVSGTSRFALAPAQDRVHLRSGQVLDDATFTPGSTIAAGPPAVDAPSGRVYVGASADRVDIYDASLLKVATVPLACDLPSVDRLALTPEPGQILALGGDRLCIVSDPFGPPDRDRDGEPDASDNCPAIRNPGQGDGDADGTGDPCDAFPDDPRGQTDSDEDGLSDEWESLEFQGLHLGAEDDPDDDGLTNAQEFDLRTDPNDPDTDGDGVGDALEHAAGRDPLLNEGAAGAIINSILLD